MRILITGSTGYIGSAALHAAQARHHDIVRLMRPGSGGASHGEKIIQADLGDVDRLRDAALEADAIIHAAASDDPSFAPVNAAAIEALLDGLDGRGTFATQGGSIVFGDTGPDPLQPAELAPPPPLAARADMDRSILSRAGTVIVYGSLIYGRGGGAIPTTLVKAAEQLGHVAVPGDGTAVWSIAHVDDVGRLLVDAVANRSTGALFPVAQRHTISELLNALAARLGMPVASVDVETAKDAYGAFGPALTMNQSFDATSAHATGWKPAHPDELLVDLFKGLVP